MFLIYLDNKMFRLAINAILSVGFVFLLSCGPKEMHFQELKSSVPCVKIPIKAESGIHEYWIYQNIQMPNVFYAAPVGYDGGKLDPIKIDIQTRGYENDTTLSRLYDGGLKFNSSIKQLDCLVPTVSLFPRDQKIIIYSGRDPSAQFDIEADGRVFTRRELTSKSQYWFQPQIITKYYFSGTLRVKHVNGKVIFSREVLDFGGLGGGNFFIFEDITHKYLLYLNYSKYDYNGKVKQDNCLWIFDCSEAQK